MDYRVLLAAFSREAGGEGAGPGRLSQQHRLYASLREAILRRALDADTALPSSRALAETLRIARNSVLYAYERLAAEGFVVADRQGTRVARMVLPAEPDADAPLAPPPLSRRATSLGHFSDRAGETGAFVPGVPALDAFPLAAWRRAVERAWRRVGPAQLDYQPSAGNLPLRHAIVDYLRVSRGVACDADQVLITDGTQHGLDLCARALADAGDVAWIENPGYGGARVALRAAGLRLVPVPVDAHGLAPAPDLWRSAPPRLVYVTPSHQYPLGAVMSPERRVALVRAARDAGAWIVEDDYDSEFRHHGTPLAALQSSVRDAPVIYLGTFSKVMFPALRIGFVVVPAAIATELERVSAALAPRGRLADQLALAEFIEAGQFTRHLRRMRRLYAERRDALHDTLSRRLGGMLTVSAGDGGMHLSARLDAGVSDLDVYRAGRAHGLVIRPLSPFCAPGTDPSAYNGLVLGYGSVAVESMDDAVIRLERAIGDAHRARRAS
ncbi:PLP-dependent aminotransferase family protein [Burkholderia glumae]|uniref:PLP-dependent aminotransferase family protein n=2 Tax=Burkholderia glumae TaxID=337 RepID=A0AAP9XV05_BURGL|nr:PLP-dependent aminotransferase family protein [Burkholderia glumae]ACR32102.1 Transcriptional regulator, GntR family [Burkholderia glumae BGR1]AJY64248.1 aminotransferase class I and II family protein [Burkholderia glumae LMG 2196 = ATCC 33617]KHJ61406.1 DNA-binding protein [Burkholderia glumae]MCM2484719.1 PLP-dependent aminotransferase family protein [Burkholderia glumae]MCM2510412.1 PLP-dependent aminotransferase family protein [Burkholderia glumae]